MTPDKAEEIAIKVIGHLVSDDELCSVFLGASGATGDDMKLRLMDRDFQVSALDFITMDDAWVIGFCDRAGLNYDQPLLARSVLAGTSGMHWT